MRRWITYALVTVVMYGVFGFLAGLNDREKTHWLVTSALMTLGVVPVLIPMGLMKGAFSGRNPRRGAAFALTTGFVGGITNLGTYAALAKGGPVSIVVPLTAAYPIVAAVAAVVLLRERINLIQLAGIIVGVTGAVLLSTGTAIDGNQSIWEQLQGALSQEWFWWTMDTLIGQAVIGILGKLSTNDLAPEGSFVLFGIVFCLFAVGLYFVERTEFPVVRSIVGTEHVSWSITSTSWILVICLGLVTGVGVLFQLMALRAGNAGIVTALTGMYPVVTALLAVTILHEPVTAKIAIGTLLVLAGAAAMSFETVKPPEIDADKPPLELS
ncbi:MAG: EamA family transporter [Pirellulales bacterium]